MIFHRSQPDNESGQTLIETLVAAFILVMGITAALGLATYSLNATSHIKQQTIALGLAREGLEVVKNMRDTNWLRGTLSTDCYDYSADANGSNTSACYKDWLTAQYNLSPAGTSGTYYLAYNSASTPPWTLVPSANLFGLNLNLTSGNVFYDPGSGITATAGNAGFARRITITKDNFTPFDKGETDLGPRLKITSEVWWSDKRCAMTDLPSSNGCSVKLETYLTNWRNF